MKTGFTKIISIDLYIESFASTVLRCGIDFVTIRKALSLMALLGPYTSSYTYITKSTNATYAANARNVITLPQTR